jgi:acyl dehydratase
MVEAKRAEHEMFKGTKPLDTAEIGDLIGSIEFVVDEALVNRLSWALDDYNPWYFSDSPFGEKVAPPTAALQFDGSMFYDFYVYPEGGSLFAKQEFEFLRPMKIGETYRLTGTLVDKYKKKGRSFFKMGVSIVGLDGVEVMRMAKTVATPVKPVLEEETQEAAK